jgi:hypothetical protein
VTWYNAEWSSGLGTYQARFYQEIAPVIGVGVPASYRAEATDKGTLLEPPDPRPARR